MNSEEQLSFDFNQPPEAGPEKEVSVKDMEEMAQAIRAQREVCDEFAAKAKVENKILTDLENKFVSTLESLGKKNYDSAVGKFSIAHRTSVRVPQGDDRKAFFEYLKAKGIFDDMITVNSQTLTAWYKAEQNSAIDNGTLLDFNVPGIDGITITPTLSFRKG